MADEPARGAVVVVSPARLVKDMFEGEQLRKTYLAARVVKGFAIVWLVFVVYCSSVRVSNPRTIIGDFDLSYCGRI